MLILSYVYFVNRTIKISKISFFNKVSKTSTDTVLNEDLSYLNRDDVMLGNSYIFNIKNSKTNKNIKLGITPHQLSINSGTHYKTPNNLIKILKNVYEKYHIGNYG